MRIAFATGSQGYYVGGDALHVPEPKGHRGSLGGIGVPWVVVVDVDRH